MGESWGRYKENLRLFFTSVCLISVLVFLSYHFAMIWKHGEFFIRETSLFARSIETIFIFMLFTFAVWNMIHSVKYLAKFAGTKKSKINWSEEDKLKKLGE